MSRGWKIAFLTLLGAALLWLAYRLRMVVLPLLIAFLLAYVLEPAVGALERRGIPRLASILGLYVLLGAFLAVLAAWGIPRAASEACRFVRETITDDDAKLRKMVLWGGTRLQDWVGPGHWEEILSNLRSRVEGRETEALQAGGRIAGAVGGFMTRSVRTFVTVLSLGVLVPVYLFFLLKNWKPWKEKVLGAIPAAQRDRWLPTLKRIHRTNAAFFRGQAAISLLEGALVFAGLLLLGVKFAFLFGLLYAVLSPLPFLGVVATFAATELFVLADAGGLTATFFLVAGLFAAIQLLESFLLQPLILGRETGLHPLAIIVALLAGGGLFGIFGMLIAVPLAASAKILFEDVVWPMIRSVASGPPPPGAAPAA